MKEGYFLKGGGVFSLGNILIYSYPTDVDGKRSDGLDLRQSVEPDFESPALARTTTRYIIAHNFISTDFHEKSLKNPSP